MTFQAYTTATGAQIRILDWSLDPAERTERLLQARRNYFQIRRARGQERRRASKARGRR